MATKYTAPIDIGVHCSAISNLGPNWESCWSGLIAGKRPFSVGSEIIAGWPECPPLAAITDFGHFNGQPTFSERFSMLLRCVALDMAPHVAMLISRQPDLRVSIIVASSGGDPGFVSAKIDSEVKPGGGSEEVTARVNSGMVGHDWELDLREAIGHNAHVSMIFGACASSLVAISSAADRINAGVSDVVVVMALDSMARLGAVGFKNIGASAANGATPYDKTRTGTTVGEGGVGLLLARNGVLQNGEIAGRVAGTAVYCDAAHMVEPNPLGVAHVVKTALEQASVHPSDVTAVYWHGTGTRQNDKTESAVAGIVFGKLSPPSTSTKGCLGHTMGASGGFNVLGACKTIETGLLPHVAGTTDPEYDNLDLVLGLPRSVRRGPVLITALGFGGINAATVVIPCEGATA